MPVSNVLNFVKSTRTTLVNFFIHDVDLGLFIFIILDPYKTQENFCHIDAWGLGSVNALQLLSSL